MISYTACDISVVDSGNTFGDYSNNENIAITLCPDNGDQFNFTVQSFSGEVSGVNDRTFNLQLSIVLRTVCFACFDHPPLPCILTDLTLTLARV